MKTIPLWTPSNTQMDACNMVQFIDYLNSNSITEKNIDARNYDQLWQWSIRCPEAFWSSIWDFCGVIGHKGDHVFTEGPDSQFQNAQWFKEASFNYAENLLRKNNEEDALVFWGESQCKRRLSWRQLSEQVSQCQQALQDAGVVSGDRVAGLLPNMPETIVAMIATASIGAIWCSASPDFGVDAVVDRFGQLKPKILFCIDHYFYGGKKYDCEDKNRRILERLDGTIGIELCYDYGGNCDRTNQWQEFLSAHEIADVQFSRLHFSHPLFVVFSSGTTGAPKCIVHSAGGVLLQHLKEHRLHSDIKSGDRVFYFTTCGWMMWNWLVTGLASEATLLLYDGNPMPHGKPILFDLADAENMTLFGTSAKFIESCEKAGVSPKLSHQLDSVRAVFSTGSPLSSSGFSYVYEHIKSDVALASISGGTDILSCFVLGSPILPVNSGEIQCRGLGMAVDVFDIDGNSVKEQKGELVCTQPFPSMPIAFWGDNDGSRYQNAYFDIYDNIWTHGDYVKLTANDGMVFYGRSDATLNPGGVRIGTAEIYRQVETIDEIVESVVIGQEWENDTRIVLFVQLIDGIELDQELVDRIRRNIRSSATPRHVPSKILSVSDIPRTRSGKVVELAVRKIVHGLPIDNIESLANPHALNFFKDRDELRR